VGSVPSQSVESAARGIPKIAEPIETPLLETPPFDQLWQESDADACGLTCVDFKEILLRVGDAQNYGLPSPGIASSQQRANFFRGLRLSDLALARACAAGSERAWERFLALFHQPLIRAAIAITGDDSLGRDLADALYAELYGLTTRDGKRRCPLDSYTGRGSLMGWLRTTLAQRHVDHYRRTNREFPLEDVPGGEDIPSPEALSEPIPSELKLLGNAVKAALRNCPAEDRFILAAYYLDERTLLQIAHTLHVHEATICRKLRKLTDGLRKQVIHNLQDAGLSKRAAQEALGTDPRDLDLNLRKVLQFSQSEAFHEKAGR
jgi:RNA polymerase sigma-70 factor, ECF subfamily